MRCNPCGGEISRGAERCPVCQAPVGAAALLPNVPVFSVRGIALAAATAVGVATLLEVLYRLTPLLGRQLAQRAAETADSSLLDWALGIEFLAAFGQALAMLTAFVLVIIWCYRARRNLDAFWGSRPNVSAGWAIAGWLVPVANLVVPFRVMADLARESLRRWRGTLLVGFWWAVWLVYLGSGQYLSRRDAEEYNDMIDAVGATGYQAHIEYYEAALVRNLIPLAAVVLAGAILIVLLRAISAAQEARIGRGFPAGLSVVAPA